MPTKLKISWFMGQRAEDAAMFSRLWSWLQDPFIETQRYDWVERTKKPFAPDPEPARLGFTRGGVLFVTGARDRFTLYVSAQPRGLTMATVYLSYKKWNPEWLGVVDGLFGELPPLYGWAASETEYEYKHRVVDVRPQGISTFVVGVTVAEIYQYLSGIYWATWFGPDVTSDLDFVAAAALPGVEVRDAGPVKRVQIAEPAETKDLATRAALEARIADALGGKYFFDRYRPERALEPAPGMMRGLTRLEQQS
jgi:hypothetical protein